VQNLDALEAQVGETLAGRPGGAVSLAVGMAQIFSALPLLGGLMSFSPGIHFMRLIPERADRDGPGGATRLTTGWGGRDGGGGPSFRD